MGSVYKQDEAKPKITRTVSFSPNLFNWKLYRFSARPLRIKTGDVVKFLRSGMKVIFTRPKVNEQKYF